MVTIDKACEWFDQFMRAKKYRYNKKLFHKDDMYFYKMWMNKYQEFVKACKCYKIHNVSFALHERYEVINL